MRMVCFIFAALFVLYSFSFSQCLDKEEISRLNSELKTGMPKNEALKIIGEYNWIQWGGSWKNKYTFRTDNPKDYKNRYVLEFQNDTLVKFKHKTIGALLFDWYVKQFGKYAPGHDSIVQAVKNGYNERMRQRNSTATCESNQKNVDTAMALPIDSMLAKLQLGITKKEMFCALDGSGWRWNRWLKRGQTERKVIDECGDSLGIIQPIGYYIIEPNTEINGNTLCLVISVIHEGDIYSEYNWVDEIKVMTSKEIKKKYYYREYITEELKKKKKQK